MPRIVCTLLVVALSACSAAAGSWPRFRGPNGNGIASDQDIPVKFAADDGIVWKTPIPGTGHSGPIVWENFVFLQSATPDAKQRLLHCFDARTGKELWSRSLPAKKGLMSNARSSLASASAATDGESVFIPLWDGSDVWMMAYSMKGELQWSKNLGPFISQHGPGASPILYKDKVIFANDMDLVDSRTKKPVARPSILYAFDKKTGEVRWETPRQALRACYSPPYIWEKDGVPELIVTSTTAVTSYNPDSGSENWHWNWTFAKDKLRTIAASYIVDDMLFASSGDGGGDRQMFAVNLHGNGKGVTPKDAWSNNKDFPYVPCSLVVGSHVYFVNDRGFAGCFEVRTGKKVWLERLHEATFAASPVLIDGKIYAPSEKGDVFVFAADPKFQLLAQNTLGEVVRASPAVSDGRLFIRGQNHLFCISKKK